MAQISNDLFFASITEIVATLRAKQVSAVELTRAFCDRLEKIGPRYNALALSLREPAIRRAKDAPTAKSSATVSACSPASPWARKTCFRRQRPPDHVWGAKPYAAQMFDEDAMVKVQKLEKGCGAILDRQTRARWWNLRAAGDIAIPRRRYQWAQD